MNSNERQLQKRGSGPNGPVDRTINADLKALDIRQYRVLTLAAGLCYPLWWFLVDYALPSPYDRFQDRLILGGFFFVCGLLSFRVKWIGEHLNWCFCLNGIVITSHYFTVMFLNGMTLPYWGCSLIVFYCTCTSLYHPKDFKVYSVSVIILVIIMVSFSHIETNMKVLMLASYLTIIPFVYYIIHSRYAFVASLVKSRETIRERTRDIEVAHYKLLEANKTRQDLLDHLNNLSKNVYHSACNIAESGNVLLMHSSSQAESVKRVTGFMKTIGAQTEENEHNADTMNKLSEKAAEASVKGQKTYHELIAAMDAIKDSVTETLKIIKTIDTIAFQTNLLALNASVEAARAGVHGKGFSVVAQEVRALAAKSAKAAQDSSDLIDKTVETMTLGSDIANENTANLNDINVYITRVADLMKQISKASQIQSENINGVISDLTHIDRVTAENVSKSEQINIATQRLSQEALAMKDMIFKL